MSKQQAFTGPAFVDEPQAEIDETVGLLREKKLEHKRLADQIAAHQLRLVKLMMDRKLATYEFIRDHSRYRIVLDLPQPTAHVKFLGVDDDA